MHIRNEAPGDAGAIDSITVEAFREAPHSSHTEQLIVRALREAGTLTVSLVAEEDGEIIGHVAISPVAISDGSVNWYGLGPVSVLPTWQGQGIGTQLMQAALAQLREKGGAGCVLLGDPGYYRRFGFQVRPGLMLPGVPPGYFQALSFDGRWPSGEVSYHAAFNATE